MNLIIAIFILLNISFIYSNTVPFSPMPVPRWQLVKLLAANGCSNKLVAHYVIDAYYSNLPTSILMARLNGVTTYQTNLISKW